MGCSNSKNIANVEPDFFTGPIEESIKARQALKRAKIKEKEEKIQKSKEEEEKKQQEEEQKRIEKEKQLNIKQQKESKQLVIYLYRRGRN